MAIDTVTYRTPEGTYRFDASRIDSGDRARLDELAAAGKLDSATLLSIVEKHPEIQARFIASDLPRPGDKEQREPLPENLEADVAGMFLAAMRSALTAQRKVRKQRLEAAQERREEREQLAEREKQIKLKAAEHRKSAALASSCAEIGAGAVQAGGALGGTVDLVKASRAGKSANQTSRDADAIGPVKSQAQVKHAMDGDRLTTEATSRQQQRANREIARNEGQRDLQEQQAIVNRRIGVRDNDELDGRQLALSVEVDQLRIRRDEQIALRTEKDAQIAQLERDRSVGNEDFQQQREARGLADNHPDVVAAEAELGAIDDKLATARRQRTTLENRIGTISRGIEMKERAIGDVESSRRLGDQIQLLRNERSDAPAVARLEDQAHQRVVAQSDADHATTMQNADRRIAELHRTSNEATAESNRLTSRSQVWTQGGGAIAQFGMGVGHTAAAFDSFASDEKSAEADLTHAQSELADMDYHQLKDFADAAREAVNDMLNTLRATDQSRADVLKATYSNMAG